MMSFFVGGCSDVSVFILHVHLASFGGIGELELNNFLYLIFDARVEYWETDLYPFVEIPVHKISRTQVDIFLTIVMKYPYACMFKITVYNASQIDVFAVTGYLRNKAADSPHDEINPYAFVACLIHFLNQFFIG